MAKGVFIYRPDSKYRDIPAESYEFPKSYLGRVNQVVGDWIVYLEPTKVRSSKGYFATARVSAIVPDHSNPMMFRAIIQQGSFQQFGTPVPFRIGDDVSERSVLNESGNISGRAQAAVRVIPSEDFYRIVDKGLAPNPILPRIGDPFNDHAVAEADAIPYFANERDRIEYFGSRYIRDNNFRSIVLSSYDERCAVTGIKLINGGGRAEVEAAHIQPVKQNGPDMLTNGLALSGTAHWMFDRGLIGIDDDLKILVSRQINNPESVRSIINETGYIIGPNRPMDRPHPQFLQWHREHLFKS